MRRWGKRPGWFLLTGPGEADGEPSPPPREALPDKEKGKEKPGEEPAAAASTVASSASLVLRVRDQAFRGDGEYFHLQ